MFSNAGYSFAHAPDGASAVRHAPERYDALIIDLASGLALCCHWRAHDRDVQILHFASVPIRTARPARRRPALIVSPGPRPTRQTCEGTPDRVLRRSGNAVWRTMLRDPRADNASKQEVAECSAAYDGESGLQEVLTHRPDVVLLDVGMPGLDGYNTCRYIRSELGNDVLIVAVTGYGQAHDKEASAGAGFDAHLTKPADSTALANLLGQRGRRRSQQSTSIR